MKHGEIPAGRLEGHHTPHHHNATPVAHLLKRRPGGTVIFRNGETGRVEPRPHDQSFLTIPIDHTVERRHLFAGGPVFRHRQAVGPRPPAVLTPFVDDGPLAVSLGIDRQDRLSVLQKNRRRMAEIDSLLPIHNHLYVCSIVQIDGGNLEEGVLPKRGGNREDENWTNAKPPSDYPSVHPVSLYLDRE